MGASAAVGDRRTLPLGIRLLLLVAFLLAVGATGLVVFADDIRLLRLAAVLALWVALIAAFAIARSRRDTRAAQRRQEEVRLAYMVELHREISARTEYEATLSRQLEAAHADQLDGLRREVDRLASALSRLLDGDVLFERVTLSAESTRVRSLSESGQAGTGHGSGAVAALDAVTVVEDPGPGADVAAGREAVVDQPDQANARSEAMPLPEIRRADAPATDWTWTHRAASPAPMMPSAPVPAPVPVPVPARRPEPMPAPASVSSPIPASAALLVPVTVAASSGDDDEDPHSSVAIGDLLAAYGLDGGSRRRRRHD